MTNGEQAGLIEKQGEIGNFCGDSTKSGDLAFIELAPTNLFGIQAGMRGKQSEHQLLGRHFQGKERDIVAWAYELIFFQVVPLAKHVASHTEGEGGFPNAWTGGQNDHFARFEACGELVEFIEA